MDITGSRLVAADRATVWRHLTSAESLAVCIPGAESVTGTAEEGFDMVVRQKVGPLRLTFAGTITLSDVVPAVSVTLTGHGRGGLAGHAHGSAGIRLADHPGGTLLSWDLGALVRGRIASLGRPLIVGVATTMTERFLDRLDALLRAGTPAR